MIYVSQRITIDSCYETERTLLEIVKRKVSEQTSKILFKESKRIISEEKHDLEAYYSVASAVEGKIHYLQPI